MYIFTLVKELTNSAVPGIPADVNFLCKYVSSTNFGAVLLTGHPITKEYYYHDMPFIRWLGKNSKTILQKFPEVKKYDLWIVTSTCSTAECALNAWNSSSKEVAVGFSSSMSQVGGFDGEVNWHTATDDEGWNFFKEKVFAPLLSKLKPGL